MRRLIHQLPAQLTTKRDLLLGASILTGFIWVFNLPGISGDLAGWARWLHWVHRHNWLIFVFAFVAWVSVTAWLVLEMRSRPASSVDRKQAATYLALGRHQNEPGRLA